LPEYFLDQLNHEYLKHFEEDETKIKVISENDTKYFYLYDIYNAEGEIEKVIHQLIQENPLNEGYHEFDKYLGKSCTSLKNKIREYFDEELFKMERTFLYENIYKQRFFVLAGSPGSGKSHELLNIVSDWQSNKEKCLLLTPTGKAALRLKTDPEFKHIEAFTIDKILTDVKNGKMLKSTLMSYHNFIIDEMSMVDLIKLRNLLRIINTDVPSFKRLVMVGDPNQLPAIGYGKVLKDVLYFLKTHPEQNNKYIELQTNCRQELAESKILEFSETFVPGGELSDDLLRRFSSGNPKISNGFRIHYWNSETELFQLIDNEFDFLCNHLGISGERPERLNKLFKLMKDGSLPSDGKFDLDIYQMITPYKSDYFGTGKINDYIQKFYKPDLELELVNDWFKQSDKIIRTKNYYDEGKLILSNGSIGLIRDDRKPLFYFPEMEEPLPVYGDEGIRKSELEHFELAYSITVHKAQGSGFNHTFFILPKKPGLLSKELLYTALTRSRESVSLFIQGNASDPFEKSVLNKARMRSYTESRKTTLLLDKPFRYYALEVDGIFIESRVELLIYQALKEAKNRFGKENFSFVYELKPVVNEVELPMKTDFTIYTKFGIWYWEHLGRLGNKKYEWTWNKVKKPSYQEHKVYSMLLTTHERNGINPDKINEIINLLVTNHLETEDITNKYSDHHYSLR
jgi:exodeoxyribonuclease V alpha subunit